MSLAWRDRLVLIGLAVIVNGIVAALISQPGYVDAYYYFNGGLAIAGGHALTEPYIWNFAYATGSLPVPAFGFWQPLASVLTAAGIVALPFLPPFDAAQAVYVLMAAVLPLLTYHVASRLGERRHAMLAGLLTVFSGFYVFYWSLPETFTPFALSGATTLILTGEGLNRPRRWIWAAAGGCAALAHLTRADGLLLIAVVVMMPLLRNSLPGRERFFAAALAMGGYTIVMLPWYLRNLATFGAIQAPGGLNSLWLVEYNDLFNYPTNLSASRYFAAGWGTILTTKLDALTLNLAHFLAEDNLVFLLPFTLISGWRCWRSNGLFPALLYGVLLFTAMTAAFSLVGARGAFFHSAGALLPFIFSAAALGLDDVLHWMAARRHWNFESSSRFFGAAMIALAALVTAFVCGSKMISSPAHSGEIAYNQMHAAYPTIGAELDTMGVSPDSPVMSNDPPGFFYFTGHGGIPLPNGDEDTLLRAADDYHVQYLVVDQNLPGDLTHLYLTGPTSRRLRLIKTYDGNEGKVQLYQIIPASP